MQQPIREEDENDSTAGSQPAIRIQPSSDPKITTESPTPFIVAVPIHRRDLGSASSTGRPIEGAAGERRDSFPHGRSTVRPAPLWPSTVSKTSENKLSMESGVSFTLEGSSPENSPVPDRRNTHPGSKNMPSTYSQVDETVAGRKSIAIQTSDSEADLAKPATGRTSKAPDDADEAEKLDTVSGNLLRVTPSENKLHGILRKTPSAKWGSASTVSFDEHNHHDKRTSFSEVSPSHSRTSSVNDLKEHGATPKKRGSAGGKRLAMFQLGGQDEPHTTESDAGSGEVSISKQNSLTDITDPKQHHKHRLKKHHGPAMPFWRRPTKKANLPRSVTMEDLKQDLRIDDHLIAEEELFHRLGVNPSTGLSSQEAAHRLERDGRNMLTPPPEVPEIIKFLKEFVGGFSPFLLIGAALCFIAYGIQWSQQKDPPGDNLYLAIVLIVVVMVTGTFLYMQKRKSEKIMEGFSKMLPQEALVLRDGKMQRISADEVVNGDIVEVSSGDRVPADIRIIQAKGLKVDNSSLTGESEPQARNTTSNENPLESKNLAFYTTNAVEGWAKGIVVRRGDSTVMGRIAKLTTRLETAETTIAREMHYFIVLIAILALGMGAIIFILALVVGYNGFYAIILAIGLVVANVPEGVVITVTVCLTLCAQRMAKKNCLVKNLEAVETLGACSVICSDKTGTLTQNRMTVAHCWVDEGIVATDTSNEKLAGANLPDTPAAKDLVRVATLCNRAVWKEGQEEKPVYARECKGDASETALLKFTQLVTGDALAYRNRHKAVAEIPFNSTTKFQVSVHEIEIDGRKRYLVAMKGAPERIWDRCKTIVSHGADIPKDGMFDKKFNDAYLELGGMGERVLGFCDLLLPEDQFPYPTEFNIENPNFPMEGLRFVGLISLIDPPRASVPSAVAKCRSAGIQVIMVTGDHPVTAKAIAKGVGIITEGSETVEDIAARRGVPVEKVDPREAYAIVVHGNSLRDMSNDEIDDILFFHAEVVFARTSPQQKLIIVEACQRLGAVVAVTGDGVNDSPALKKANIGIAMGITGSDVSKQAADMVLLDDNFASIVTGIEEGRLIFENLKKTICYTLTANIPEIAPVVLYFILSIPIGLTTIPMLLVCIGTDMVPSFSMAYESAESDIMKLPPRSPDERLVGMKLIHCSYLQAGVIASAGAFYAYFVVFGDQGFRPYDLFMLRDAFENPGINDLQDSYGQEWTYSQRLYLSRTVQATFFAAIVVFQWIDVIVRRCRRVSIFQKPLTNQLLNFSILFETAVACLCIYVPVLNYALNLYHIWFVWWLPMIPFAIFFLLFDEIRRYIIRRYPNGWMEREFYF